jgi:hypothetical protein
MWQRSFKYTNCSEGNDFGKWTWNVIRQGKGQSVVVCGRLYQHSPIRPQNASVSKTSNRQPLETSTSQIQVWSLTATTNLLCKTWTRRRSAHKICDLHCNGSEHSVLTVIPKSARPRAIVCVCVCVEPKGLTLYSCVPDGMDLLRNLLLFVKIFRNCTHRSLSKWTSYLSTGLQRNVGRQDQT